MGLLLFEPALTEGQVRQKEKEETEEEDEGEGEHVKWWNVTKAEIGQ